MFESEKFSDQYNLFLFSAIDLIMVPIILIALYFYLNKIALKNLDLFEKKLIHKVLILFIIGVFINAFLGEYYYDRYGDAYLYYGTAVMGKKALLENQTIFFDILFNQHENFDAPTIALVGDIFNHDPTTENFTKVGVIINLFTFNSYLSNALIYAFLSFLGLLKLFMTFKNFFPQLNKVFIYSFFCMPSIWIWSGGMLKEPICLYLFGTFIYSIYKVFYLKNFNAINTIFILFSIILLFLFKVYYIITGFVLIFVFLIGSVIQQKNKTLIYKFLIFSILIGGLIISYSQIEALIQSSFEKYSLENFSEKVLAINDSYITKEVADFKLPELNFSFGGTLNLIGYCSLNTFFRPFFWEIKKPIQILNIIENTIFLIALVKICFQGFIFKSLKIIFSDKILIAILIAILGIGFIMSLTTLNYGSLARYRAPFLPLVSVLLFGTLSKLKEKNAKTN